MAIASCSVKIISRGKGRSAVAAAAYRAGQELQNGYDGLTHSYTRKGGILYSAILTPAGAPEWAQDRQQLWTLVEQTERRKDAQLAREVMIALPRELTASQNIELARAYAQTFVREGMVADVSVHDGRDGNPHAHILLTLRPLAGDRFGKKCREWNATGKLVAWREQYATLTNQFLERYGHDQRIDARSYEAQGIDQVPTVHLGPHAHRMEQKGIVTERGDINREIERANQEIAAINREIALLQKEHEQEAALKHTSVPLEPSGVLSRFPEDRENKERGRRAEPSSPPQPEHRVRPFHDLPTDEPERPEATTPPPLPHRHPVGRTWAQHRHAAFEPGHQRDAAGRDQPPPLRRHFESRRRAQPHRTPEEPERRGPPEPSGDALSPRSQIDHNHMRRMVSPESETFAEQHKTESDKFPEKEQDYVRPTSPGGERKLGFRDLRETLKKEYEQEKQEERNRSSRNRPDRER